MFKHICGSVKNLSAEQKIRRLFFLLKRAVMPYGPTLMDSLKATFGDDPYIVLIGCLLSLRTRDTVTESVAKALLKEASTARDMIQLGVERIATIIHPVGFYATKARVIWSVSNELIRLHKGKVPSTYTQLIALKGVGPKTANLVLAEGFGIPAICVDTHVHRLANAFGLVHTKTVEETELALTKILPRELWITCNRLLVKWGQNGYSGSNKRCPWCVLIEKS